MKRLFFLFPFLILLITGIANATCDCGSTNPSSPCTGTTWTTTVTGGTPNGGVPEDGIYTYTFNSGGSPAKCGFFADGVSLWVAPADGETDVTFTAITTTSTGPIKTEINPVPDETSFASNATRSYPNWNESLNIIPSLPQTYSGITSLVSALQRDESYAAVYLDSTSCGAAGYSWDNTYGCGSCGTSSTVGACVDSYDTVTVLSSVPENCGTTVIRPNVTGTTKELLTWDDFDLTRIPSKVYINTPTTTNISSIVKVISHMMEFYNLYTVGAATGSEGGRAMRPHQLVDDYGGGYAAVVHNYIAMLAASSLTLEEKKPAIAAMLAFGNDLYHAKFDSGAVTRWWNSGATQHPGRFAPAAFIAALETATTKTTNTQTVAAHAHDYSYAGPVEIQQINEVRTGTLVWGDMSTLSGVNRQGAYWDELISAQCYDNAPGTCNLNVGAKVIADPYGYIDGPGIRPGSGYMSISFGTQQSLAGLMVIYPAMRTAINYDKLYTYVDRMLNDGLIAVPDPCTIPDSREDFVNCDPYRNQNCDYYGVTWGPITPTNVDSACIEEDTDATVAAAVTAGYTHAGRFSTTRNGLTFSTIGNQSALIADNWSSIAAEWDSPEQPETPIASSKLPGVTGAGFTIR